MFKRLFKAAAGLFTKGEQHKQTIKHVAPRLRLMPKKQHRPQPCTRKGHLWRVMQTYNDGTAYCHCARCNKADTVPVAVRA